MKKMIIGTYKKFRTNEKFNFLAAKSFNFLTVKRNIKGKNNTVSYNGAFLKNVSIEVRGDNNSVFIEPLSKLENCKIIINGSNHTLEISRSYINNTIFSFVQNGGKITIGSNTTMGQVTFLSGEGKFISIGNDCMFSDGIEVRTTDSHSVISLKNNERINYGNDIKIGNHVWVGIGCRIWKGAVIGNDSIIAYNSIVSKPIPPNSIAKGSPARIQEGLQVTWDRKLIE